MDKNIEKKVINPKKLGPTLTLAQLYESQNQLFDAYAVYHKLYEFKQSEEVINKLLNVRKKIMLEMNLKYSDDILKAIDLEDLKKFHILPKKKFIELEEAIEIETVDVKFPQELELEEEKEREEVKKEVEQDREKEEEKESALEQVNLATKSKEIADIKESITGNQISLPESILPFMAIRSLTVKELTQKMLVLWGEEKKIGDVKIFDFLKLFGA